MKRVTVYHRNNKIVAPYTKFDVSPFKKVFNPDRMQSLVMRDALVDPTQTISPYVDPLDRDPGYIELNKRNTI